MSFLKTFRILSCVALLPSAVCAHYSPEIQRVHALHEKGVHGDKDAVIACIELAEGLLEANDKNHMARVYLGSAYTLRSRDLRPGPEKLRTLRHGGALMDEAVEAAPQNPRVRLIRAINNYQLPGIFGRRPIAIADFVWLVEWVRKHPASLQTDEKQALYFFAGQAFSRSGNKDTATMVWERGILLDPESELGQKIRSRIGG